jgi:hypothetical protein
MPAGVSAYTALANVTLGSSAASVTFSSISQAYRDLVLVFQGTSSVADRGLYARINSDSGSNYSYVSAYGNGSTAASESGTSSYILAHNGSASSTTVQSLIVYNFMDYSATDKHKTILIRENQPSGSTYNDTAMLANRWANTAAITSISFIYSSGNLNAGTTVALYGVSA